MATGRLPFLRGEIERTETFRDPRGGGAKTVSLPTRDQSKHRKFLLGQLDKLQQTVSLKGADARDEEARREVVSVEPSPGSELPAELLASERDDVLVVGVDPATGTVLVDAATPDLKALRRKIDLFGDSTKSTPSGRPRNEPLVAPLERIALASLADRSREPLDLLETLGPQWFEISCRGGIYDPDGSEASSAQIERQLGRLDSSPSITATFVTTTSVVFYAKLSLSELETLVARTDCIFEVGLATRKIRDGLYFERDEEAALDVQLSPPPENAPTVVLLDTGIADWHPLVQPAIRGLNSVVPGIVSGVDVDGHGTEMAGVALHLDGVGDAISLGGGRA